MHSRDKEHWWFARQLTIALFCAFFLIACWFVFQKLTENNQPVVINQGSVESAIHNIDQEKKIKPADWLTYTNEDNGFSFSYPPQWGEVNQSSYKATKGNSTSYQYRFEQNQDVIMSQPNIYSANHDHDSSFLYYNKFSLSEDGNEVLFCMNEECETQHKMRPDQLDFFTNQTLKESVEIFVVDGSAIRLNYLINNDFGLWPGVVISGILEKDADLTTTLDKLFEESRESNAEMANDLRLLAEFID